MCLPDSAARTINALAVSVGDHHRAGILAHGFLRLRRVRPRQASGLQLQAPRFCPSSGALRMSQTAAHLVDHVIPHVPVRQWVLPLPIPLRVLLAAQPELVTPMLQVVQRVITRHLLDRAQLSDGEGHGGAVTLIQRIGSAANLNIHLHCLVLDGVYRRATDGVPAFIEAGAPTDDELHEPSRTRRFPSALIEIASRPDRHGYLNGIVIYAPSTSGRPCRLLLHLLAQRRALVSYRLDVPLAHAAVAADLLGPVR